MAKFKTIEIYKDLKDEIKTPWAIQLGVCDALDFILKGYRPCTRLGRWIISNKYLLTSIEKVKENVIDFEKYTKAVKFADPWCLLSIQMLMPAFGIEFAEGNEEDNEDVIYSRGKEFVKEFYVSGPISEKMKGMINAVKLTTTTGAKSAPTDVPAQTSKKEVKVACDDAPKAEEPKFDEAKFNKDFEEVYTEALLAEICSPEEVKKFHAIANNEAEADEAFLHDLLGKISKVIENVEKNHDLITKSITKAAAIQNVTIGDEDMSKYTSIAEAVSAKMTEQKKEVKVACDDAPKVSKDKKEAAWADLPYEKNWEEMHKFLMLTPGMEITPRVDENNKLIQLYDVKVNTLNAERVAIFDPYGTIGDYFSKFFVYDPRTNAQVGCYRMKQSVVKAWIDGADMSIGEYTAETLGLNSVVDMVNIRNLRSLDIVESVKKFYAATKLIPTILDYNANPNMLEKIPVVSVVKTDKGYNLEANGVVYAEASKNDDGSFLTITRGIYSTLVDAIAKADEAAKELAKQAKEVKVACQDSSNGKYPAKKNNKKSDAGTTAPAKKQTATA